MKANSKVHRKQLTEEKNPDLSGFSINQDTRIIVIYDAIDNHTAKSIADQLPMMDIIMGDILVKLNSYGGELSCSLTIANEFKKARNNIIVDVTGVAMSGASLILLGGKTRLISSSGVIMFHSPSWMSEHESLEEHMATAWSTKEHWKRILENFLETTNLSPEEFFKKTEGKEWYITPKQALKYGIVHKVY